MYFVAKRLLSFFYEIIYIFAYNRFVFFIFVSDEKFHINMKTMHFIIQFCLCNLNSPRSKYFIKISLMVFDSQICTANIIPQVRPC